MKAFLYISALSVVLPHVVSASANCENDGSFFNDEKWKVVIDKACTSAVKDNQVSGGHQRIAKGLMKCLEN